MSIFPMLRNFSFLKYVGKIGSKSLERVGMEMSIDSCFLAVRAGGGVAVEFGNGRRDFLSGDRAFNQTLRRQRKFRESLANQLADAGVQPR